MRLAWLLLVAACSDYDLNPKPEDPGDVGDSGAFVPDTGGGEDGVCEDLEFPAGSVGQTDACNIAGPPVGSFTPVLEWKKDSFSILPSDNQVMMMPAVGSLTDDDGDGDADENDVPDIVFISYGSNWTSGGVIRVVSGDGGREHLSISGQSIQGTGGLALGDLDNDGWTDIVAATTSGVKAFDRTGRLLWTGNAPSGSIYGTSDNPAISDMDGDGNPEVIMGSAIWDNRGTLVGHGRSGIGGVNGNNVGTTSFAVDVDGDGLQEVVTGNALYNRDGSIKARNTESDGYPAVGNFDADDKAEIVVTSGGSIRLQDDDMTVLCRVSIPGAGSAYYGGPPTVADFDGDGEAEFAAASGSRYSVFERDCSVKWQATTQDASSGNTGSSVFDFEGDGQAEAVYADETRLWAFAGPDGAVKLESTEHSNATWLEYPSIADVDGDGQAEIVVANTIYTTSRSGIYVFGDADASWMPGRRIWNQHAYHITNVNDDGSIPAVADRNWLSYNNFRSGDLSPVGGYSLPDLYPTIEAVCLDECDERRLVAWVSVANAGYLDVEDDVELRLLAVKGDGSEVEVGTYTVTDTLVQGQKTAAVRFVVDPTPDDMVELRAELDGGTDSTRSLVEECVEDNNLYVWSGSLCD